MDFELMSCIAGCFGFWQMDASLWSVLLAVISFFINEKFLVRGMKNLFPLFSDFFMLKMKYFWPDVVDT